LLPRAVLPFLYTLLQFRQGLTETLF